VSSDEQSLCPPLSTASTPSLSQLKSVSDEDLLELLKRGCNDAMTVLFRRYHKLVLSICRKILRNATEAEDVMQDVFFEVFRRAARFDPSKGNLKPWLIQLGYSRALNRRQYLILRHFYDSARPLPNPGKLPEPNYTPDCLLGLTMGERFRILEKAMEQLTPKQRQAIELTYFKGLLINEIAQRMGESQVNAKNHYYRGLKKIREVLEELEVEVKEKEAAS
jgi:RNA polymerase sigma-70 factor (ECF subfamily)